MRSITIVVGALLAAAACVSAASLTSSYSSAHWQSKGRAPAAMVHCVKIAIRHTDEARAELESTLLRVSDPRHSDYGRYHSLAQLSSWLAPPADRIETIRSWITSRAHPALDAPRITLAEPNRDFMDVCMSVKQSEHIFGTELHLHSRNPKAGASTRVAIRAVQPVQIPDHVAQHIDFLSGLNTPIHHYQARKASAGKFQPIASEAEKLSALAAGQLHQQNVGTGGSSAPVLTLVYGGNELMNIGFVMYCNNGGANNDTGASAPCSSTGNAITGFNLQITITGLPTRQALIPLSSVTLGSDGRNSASYLASMLVDVRKYMGYTVQVQSIFATGAPSPYSAANAPAVYATDYVTPTFLKQLYGIPLGLQVSNPAATQSVAEFLEQSYNPADLNTYFAVMGIPNQTVANTIGPNIPAEGSITGGEAQLDIQVIMSIAVNSPTWFWLLPGPANTSEPFDQWLADVAANPAAPLVHSVSYADAEHGMDQGYTDRLNAEFQKAGVRGLTMLFASGDDGIASYEGRTDPTACNAARPEFPSASPWITSVGGTQLSLNSAPACAGNMVRGVPVGCTPLVETTCSARLGGVITSGGGFSNYYPRPDYQTAAVNAYFTNTVQKPPAGFFNPNGRGYPDISGMAAAYLVQMGSTLVPESGTSASTPLWASMVTLWNDVRLSTGQPPLGFLNPLLYQLAASHPDVFNDVTVGDNKCLVDNIPCCTNGFYAAPGWDPNTGLGSPKFTALSNYMINPNAPFSYVSPQLNAVNTSSTDNKAQTALVVSIIGLVLATIAFVGFLISTFKHRAHRQEGLLGTS